MKDNIFGKNLQKAREGKYKTKADFAKALGIHSTSYGQYENGRREPSFDLLVKIADMLDVSVDQLLRYNTDVNYKESARKIELSGDVKKYIQGEIQRTLIKVASSI